MAAEPQFHRRPLVPGLRNFDGVSVVAREEIAAVIDVAAKAVHEIESVTLHRAPSRMASRTLALIHSRNDSLLATHRNRPLSGLGRGDMPRYQARQSRRRPVGA